MTNNPAMTGLYLYGAAFIIIPLLALLIAWIILPFAMIGTKPLLKQLLAEQRHTNALLRQLQENSTRQTSALPSSPER